MTPIDARLNHIAVARRSVLEDRGSLQSSYLDSWIERSWKRCLSKGFEPQTKVQFAQISSQDLRRVEAENHDLIRAAKPLMDKLGRSASLIALGVLFLGGGWELERIRRQLLIRIGGSA